MRSKGRSKTCDAGPAKSCGRCAVAAARWRRARFEQMFGSATIVGEHGGARDFDASNDVGRIVPVRGGHRQPGEIRDALEQ